MNDRIAIVGAGFSGTLLAVNLLRRGAGPVTLIERRGDQRARGVAYGSPHPAQLLNVRAGGMSALPDDPSHFVRWLEARGEGGAASFVPRATYGAYLAETLEAARRDGDGRLTLVDGAAIDLDEGADRVTIRLADGRTVAASRVVLATGNLPPHAPPGIDPAALPGDRYLDDPWRAEPAAGLGPDDTVVLLGTGLTAVDVALELDAAGFRGRTLALSRRGLRPRAHADGLPPVEGATEVPGGTLSDLVGEVRQAATADGWRHAVDRLRPVTQALWQASDDATRARFLRHLRPYWDVHRHRIAPAVAAGIDAMVADGRLVFAAGKVIRAAPEGAGVRLTWRPRGAGGATDLVARRVVNCTGPQGDLTRTTDPLLAALHRRGAIRPDRLRLGIEVDARCRVVRGDGRSDDRLLCVGPMTRAAAWEIVAVPDIRHQVADLARRLTGDARGL